MRVRGLGQAETNRIRLGITKGCLSGSPVEEEGPSCLGEIGKALLYSLAWTRRRRPAAIGRRRRRCSSQSRGGSGTSQLHAAGRGEQKEEGGAAASTVGWELRAPDLIGQDVQGNFAEESLAYAVLRRLPPWSGIWIAKENRDRGG